MPQSTRLGGYRKYYRLSNKRVVLIRAWDAALRCLPMFSARRSGEVEGDKVGEFEVAGSGWVGEVRDRCGVGAE